MLKPAVLSACLVAAAASAAPQDIGHATVADALAALNRTDGSATIVTESDGWVVVAEPSASAQWSFTPAGHPAHPAVVRRVIRRDGGAVRVETSSLCEGPAPACAQLLSDFETLNDRITQAVRSRGRPMPPTPP